MPVPNELKNSSHMVFCYSSDLSKAAKKLAKLIGGSAVRVYVEGRKIVGVEGKIKEGAQVAWLVGHGLSNDTLIGTPGCKNAVEISEPLGWLEEKKYSAVVDTCCQPDQRRQVAAKYDLDYYSCPDGSDVAQIIIFDDVDSWWNTCDFRLRSKKQQVA